MYACCPRPLGCCFRSRQSRPKAGRTELPLGTSAASPCAATDDPVAGAAGALGHSWSHQRRLRPGDHRQRPSTSTSSPAWPDRSRPCSPRPAANNATTARCRRLAPTRRPGTHPVRPRRRLPALVRLEEEPRVDVQVAGGGPRRCPGVPRVTRGRSRPSSAGAWRRRPRSGARRPPCGAGPSRGRRPRRRRSGAG